MRPHVLSPVSVKPLGQGGHYMGGGKPVMGATGMTPAGMTTDMALLGPAAATGAAPGPQPHAAPAWEGRSIATHKLRLVEFSAFLEQQTDHDTVSFLDVAVGTTG